MTIYGLIGRTHSWGRLLTVMSPAGNEALMAAIQTVEGLEVVAGPGRLTQFHEKRGGSLQALIQANGIQVLEKPDWDAKKAELGAAIW
ncbi:MAG: hypothetical protein AAF495_11985 [Pseudomonadota bacterium]